MMRASLAAAACDRKLQEERRQDGLGAFLRNWTDAAAALASGVSRARSGLEQQGTPREHLDRIEQRLQDLRKRSRSFDLASDLDPCAESWNHLGMEIASLAGPQRDSLVRLLAAHKGNIDRATADLSEARKTGGRHPERHRRVRELEAQRDRAQQKYASLREEYLASERRCAAEAKGTRAPVLPLPRGLPVLPLPHLPGLPVAQGVSHLPLGRPAPHALSVAHHGASGGLPKAVLEAQRTQAPRVLKITPRGIAHAPSFAPGPDGIGAGLQTAHISFEAQALDAAPAAGTLRLELGAGCRLDVLPSVSLESGLAGAALRRGKLSLALISSGGRLGGVPAADALGRARERAKEGARAVAAQLGHVGAALEKEIASALDEAARKIFGQARAGAVPRHDHRHPQHGHGHRQAPRSGAVEHHVGRFQLALGEALHEARNLRVVSLDPRLDRAIDRDRQAREGVAGRLEKTLGSLSTAAHRTLTDPNAGELRGHLARMDGILARLKGNKAAQELLDGAHEIGSILSEMGTAATTAGGAAHLQSFRKLLEERRTALAKLAGEARKAAGAEALHPRGALPQPSALALGEKQLEHLRKLHPGIDSLLRSASSGQLARDLARVEGPAGLHTLQPGRGGGLGLRGLGGMQQSLGGAHLAGLGSGHQSSLAALGSHGGMAQLLIHQMGQKRGADVRGLLGDLKSAPAGTPLNEVARRAEERQRQLALRANAHRGPAPAQLTAQALGDAFRSHGRGEFAAHVAAGGALYPILQSVQRSHGLPVSQLASHFLQSRGAHQLLGSLQTFHQLVGQGNRPHFGLFSRIKDAASSTFHAATSAVSSTVGQVKHAAGTIAQVASKTVNRGISDLAHGVQAVSRGVHRAYDAGTQLVHRAYDAGTRFAHRAYDAGTRFAHRAYDAGTQFAHRAYDAGRQFAHRAYDAGMQGAHRLYHAATHPLDTAKALYHAAAGAAGRVKHGISDVVHGVGHVASWAMHKAGEAVGGVAHKGMEWLHKTGVAGAIGKGLKYGVSMIKTAVKYSPLGLAVQGFHKAGGLKGIWDKTKHMAGAAWGGIQKAYHATSSFLQSPAGQLLVTGLSLAASFIPGGMIVKGLVGGAIGAMQAISEGKDWKHVLLSAGSGALTGALPFLKLGPLAKVGMGALTGAVTTLAGGGSLKDALKGAAGGAVDAFDPGALKALGRLKSLKTAEKILKGQQLSKLEKLAVQGSHLKGPISGLEKLMAKPGMRRAVGGMEKAFSKGVKGGIWVSGKAAKGQGYLDKALAMGDKLEGGLAMINEMAPEVAGALGDNALGHFVGKVGDYAGAGDDKLKKALEMGHGASDKLQQYRGYLDKGLGYAGVKDPKKAYDLMMARKAASQGKKSGIEAVAKDKLARHKAKHPELYAATRHGGARPPALRDQPGGRRGAHADAEHGRAPRRREEPKTALERALARGKKLMKEGREVAQGVHDGLHKVHQTVGKSLEYADKLQGGLEKAAALARQGAGVFGDDTELGAYLNHAADRADQVHGYVEQGIGFAKDFNERVGKVEGGLEHIPGVHEEPRHRRRKKIDEAPEQEHVTHDAGGKPRRKGGTEADWSPSARKKVHGDEAAAHETEEQRAQRMRRAWDAIGNCSSRVQRFETSSAKRLLKVRELMDKGQTHEASLELMGLGSEVDDVSKAIREAKALAKGNEKYEKEIAFYEEWHHKARAKIHGAIADTKDLGKHVAVSGFGISEKTHADIYENTRAIFAVQGKVIAFAGALSDKDAKAQVEKVLAEAKAAKAQLNALKAKYKGDKAAYQFLTGHREQDRLIDQSIAKLEQGLHGGEKKDKKAEPARKDAGGKKLDLGKAAEHGLQKLDDFRKKAVKAGWKVDAGLGKVEKLLKRGISVGKKVDHGLEQTSKIAGQLSDLFGEDSAIGHFAGQVQGYADQGHEKVHGALEMAQKGKKGVHDGRKLLEDALHLGAKHHAEKHEQAQRRGHPHEQAPHPDEMHLPHQEAHHGPHGHPGAHRGPHPDHGGHPGHAPGGGYPHPAHRGSAAPAPRAHPAPHAAADPQAAMHGAAQAVAHFGQAVEQAIADVQMLLQRDLGELAAARIRSVNAVSEQTRAAVTAAVRATGDHPGLAGQAGKLREHYLQIRGHFFQFVSGLHGLHGKHAAGVDAKSHPELAAVSGRIDDLRVKVDALGDAREGGGATQQAVHKLQQEATQLEQALGHLERAQQKDPAAGGALKDLRHKLDGIRKALAGHRAQSARGGGAPGAQPVGSKRRKPQDRHHDLIDEVLHGVDDGRVFVDHGAHRGDFEHHDEQEVDPAAQDTWIGSGEGVKLFSDVFGAFLPAEGAPGRRGHHHRRRRGHGGRDHPAQHDGPAPHPAPRRPPAPAHRRRKKKTGFFAGLFQGLEDFADNVAHAAHAGAGILGKAMHYAEMGMHGLNVVEHSAEKVHDFAGKAEGFLHSIHLEGAAGLAHKIGDAAGWVDDKSKQAHEGLKTADQYLGEGKKDLGKVESFSHQASHALKGAEHGKFGELISLFRAAKSGDGVDGKLQPEKVRLGSAFDEPRRLDATTLSRMETFLDGDFAGVRVHTGPGAAEITGRYAAEAVTVKDHIFFAPGRFNPSTLEGQKLLAHELTHVLQKGRKNLDVRTAESEALHSEHSYGQAPQMETLNLGQPQPDFKLSDGEGLGLSSGIHTAKRTRSRGQDAGGKDELPDGEEFLDKVSGRVYELLMEELEHSFESR